MENIENIEQPTDIITDPAGTGANGEKLFTQEQVNEIVRKRLERVKQEPPAPKEPTELEKREMAVAAAENRMKCQNYLSGHKLPSELLDILDTSDPEEFNKRANMVGSLIRAAKGVAPLFEPHTSNSSGFDIDAAFTRNKHTPRDYRSPRNI